MTKDEKRIQIALGTYLTHIRNESQELYTERDKLYSKADKLQSKINKLENEHSSLLAKGNDLHSEGMLLYYNAAIEVYGPDLYLDNIDFDTGEIIADD